MAEKNIKSRIVHKHDLESNWLLATNFIPKQGELVVYDIDDNYNYERIKIGDGVQNVNDLPFAVVQADLSQSDPTAADYIKGSVQYINEQYSRQLFQSTEQIVTPSSSIQTVSFAFGTVVDRRKVVPRGATIVVYIDGTEALTGCCDGSSIMRDISRSSSYEYVNESNGITFPTFELGGTWQTDRKTGLYAVKVYLPPLANFTDAESVTVTIKVFVPAVYIRETRLLPDRVVKDVTANVGQTLIVTDIDDYGYATKWEAADLPAAVSIDATLVVEGSAADAKATGDAISAVSDLVGDTSVSEQISTAIDEATADDFGVYVQDTEPTDAVAGDIWIDTANDPSYIPPTIPEITEADNGKVLMVVNGKLQLVNLNLSIDANGVVSI